MAGERRRIGVIPVVPYGGLSHVDLSHVSSYRVRGRGRAFGRLVFRRRCTSHHSCVFQILDGQDRILRYRLHGYGSPRLQFGCQLYRLVGNRQAEIMMRIASEFGFTPASRSRIATPPPAEPTLFDMMQEPDDTRAN